MISVYKQKQDCYGCSACANICPRGAIQMKADEQGFLYPKINQELCINCGLCEKACPIGKEAELQHTQADMCLGIKHTEDLRRVSSSGGAYTALSDVILKQGGKCTGVLFDENMNAVHSVAETEKERNLFRGSKYVQSDMGDIYHKINELLRKGQQVMFSGTPCQCGALRSYLKTKHTDCSNLMVMDMVCHGVPSPEIWKEHVASLEKQAGSKMVSYTFRNKEKGWRGYHIKAIFENGIQLSDTPEARAFCIMFSENVMLRPSCYYCPYSSLKRCSDLTIGDFWGIEQLDPEFSDNKGISMLLINTEKGRKLYEQCDLEKLIQKEYPTEKLTQPNLHSSTNFSKEYDKFWSGWKKHGYPWVKVHYGRAAGKLSKLLDLKYRIKRRLKRS